MLTAALTFPSYQRKCQCLQLQLEDEVKLFFWSRTENEQQHGTELQEELSGRLGFDVNKYVTVTVTVMC